MLEGLGDRRIRFRLASLTDRDLNFAPVERRATEFAGYIRTLLKILDHSPLGRTLVRFAALHDVTVGLDPLLEPHASYFYPNQNHFDLGYQPELLHRSEKGISRYLVSFVAGLRRVWHHRTGNGPDVSLRPQDFLRLCRCAEADIEAVTHLIAWELRSGGATFLWRHLLSGPNGDISVVFERAIHEGPPRQFDAVALKCAFDQWFAERERANACDHFALEVMDMALVQQASVVGLSPLRPGRAAGLGMLPSGQNYLEGFLFTGAWYDVPEDDFNAAHLRHIEQDIIQLLEKEHYSR
ncbi:MAG: DUF6782 family putative metallopeptidase [Alphaproteobacteria bacterium]